jgi:alkaline phosphatase D
VVLADDHDFGLNNGGNNYADRAASMQLFLDFVDEPAASPRRSQSGLYTAYDFGVGDETVRLILLDNRFNRDTDGATGDMLGDEQWKWLEQQVRFRPCFENPDLWADTLPPSLFIARCACSCAPAARQ